MRGGDLTVPRSAGPNGLRAAAFCARSAKKTATNESIAPFSMPEEPKQGSKLGNYELVLRVGRGGMAAVWVARERAAATKDDRLVAVKVMLTELADESEFVKMFLDEVRLIRSIRHPNVVDVYDVGEDDGMMWMAMEWVEGESLHTVIAEAGKRRALPPDPAGGLIAHGADRL